MYLATFQTEVCEAVIAEWFVEELMIAEEDNKNKHLSLSNVVIHLKQII